MATKRKLIILAFYINVEGLSKKMAEDELYSLVNLYNNLPDDINEQYHVERIWIPIKKGASKVELIYPSKFNFNDVDIEEVDTIIEQLKKIKDKE